MGDKVISVDSALGLREFGLGDQYSEEICHGCGHTQLHENRDVDNLIRRILAPND
jgi:uncharacterized alpha/beta hydrolase family protein